MNNVPPFSDDSIEALAKALGDCGTGYDIDLILEKCQIEDNSNESTKWRRLKWVFTEIQRKNGCADKILEFMRHYLNPLRLHNRNITDMFLPRRGMINWILSFNDLQFSDDGKFCMKDEARTFNEAVRQEQNLQGKMRQRDFHPEMIKYCKDEIEREEYFHAVFEAAKGLAQRIREKSGVNDKDGVDLVNRVFSEKKPMLALNQLQTPTEQNEQKGFASLLRGCFGLIRNPVSHEPKIHWKGEDDAADYLSLLSLLHRKLDDCILVPSGNDANS